MPDTLHARLRAAVEERLAAARAATPGPWRWSPNYGDPYVADAGGIPVAPPPIQSPDAEFIAANDPAATVRRCEALLRVVERHAPEVDRQWGPKTDPKTGELADAVVDEYCRWCIDGGHSQWPCPDIRDLAAGEGIEVGDG